MSTTTTYSRDWGLRMAQMEEYLDADFGAGPLQHAILLSSPNPNDPLYATEEPTVVFGRFVELMRRRQGLTIERLAEVADIDVVELLEIEDILRRPEPRTVYQLAVAFGVPGPRLLQVAGLTAPKDATLINEGVRFAARSNTVSQLSPEERAALEAFVSVLDKHS